MSVSHFITGGLVHLSGNPIQVTLTAGFARNKHRLALKITCDHLLGSPFVDEIAPKNLVSVFDISGYVDQPVSYSFDYPATGVINPHDLLAFRVSLDIGEVWTDGNGDRQEQWMNLSENHQIRVIKGKLRPYELGILNDSGKNFYTEYINGGKFLSHLPDFQKVGPDQIPLLWYLSRWPGNHQATAHLTINTNLGQPKLTISRELVFYDITGLVDFAVQPRHWGFQAEAGEQVLSYEFWLSDSEGDISERRSFVVDNSYYEKSFLFYYVNPLSGVDCIRLTGQYSEGLKTESGIAYRPVPVLSGSRVAGQTTISGTSQRSWELNTGSRSKAEILALRDFLTARQCWMADPGNAEKLIPVTIETGDHRLFDSGEDIQHLDIKILEAHK